MVSAYGYQNNPDGLRTSMTSSGKAFTAPEPAGAATNDLTAVAVYDYNARHELTGTQRYWGADPQAPRDAVGLQSWTYQYDDIGNRTASTRDGTNVLYTANDLNQYTQRDVPGLVYALGTASTGAVVTVNLEPAVRQGAYFHQTLGVTNAPGAGTDWYQVNCASPPRAGRQADRVGDRAGRTAHIATFEAGRQARRDRRNGLPAREFCRVFWKMGALATSGS